MQKMMEDGHKMYGYVIPGGTYYDTGNKLEYLKTVIDFGLAHEELGPELEKFVRQRLNS